MRRRAGSGFPRSPQLSPEQAANRVVVSRVSPDVGERTPMARHCNVAVSPSGAISILIIGESRKASAAPRLIVCSMKRLLSRCCQRVGNCQLVSGSRLADGGPSEGEFVDVQVADFPLERLARNAELRRRAARAGNPAERLLERGFDQGPLTVRQGGHGRAVRRLALLAREPRLIDHERLPLTQHDGTLDHVLELAYVA